jgi:hypothetical protein
MKSIKKIVILMLSVGMILSVSSCLVFVEKGHPKHKKGWTKNTNNPHHPRTTNPGKGHSKGHKHPKNRK